MRCNCCFLLPLLLSLAHTPTVEAAERDDLLTAYALASWNDGDGRPLGSVHAIVQATSGYLWVGADAGLFRFDGSRFAPWDVIGDAALPAVPVRALFEDRQGTLWVSTSTGLFRPIRQDSLPRCCRRSVRPRVAPSSPTQWPVGRPS